MTDLTQPISLNGRELVRTRDDIGSFHRPIERTGVDGVDVIICQPLGKALRLYAPNIGEKYICRAGEFIFRRKRCRAMSYEVESCGHGAIVYYFAE